VVHVVRYDVVDLLSERELVQLQQLRVQREIE
jgi:hypothetical protein